MLYPSCIPQSSKLLQLNPMLVHNVQQSLDGRVAAVTARGVRGFRRGGRSWTRGEGHGIGVGHMDIFLLGYKNYQIGYSIHNVVINIVYV